MKRLSIGIAVPAFLMAAPAFAQTPVNTSVQISGSCSKCDLSHKHMERMSLQGSNFAGSDFSHSNLSGGKFYKSNLAGASFNKAYMMRVEGDGVILHKSILRDATLTEATLTNSDLSLADLKRADLVRANFQGSSFKSAFLKAADAMEANFQAADMTGAKLTHGNFTNAKFTGAILKNVDFGDAIVEQCDFTGADLSGANLYSATGLTEYQLIGACGDERTILPEGMTLSVCPESESRAVMADAMQESSFAGAPSAPKPPAAKVPFYLKSSSQNLDIVKEVSDIDMIIADIDSAMRDLPFNSPSRVKLENSVKRLEKMKAKTRD
jgi:uncharacterized protein YjbI with pentapeptide repeats